MIDITEIGSLAGLEALREEWDALLLSTCPGVAIFQTWEWIHACARRFGRRSRLMILCLREGGALIGIAPLEITSMYGLPLRRLQFIGTGVSDYLDFIIAAGREEQALAALFVWMTGNSGRWDLSDLQQLPEGSPTTGFCGGNDTWTGETIPGEKCPYLPLAESWDVMLARFGKKMRWNLGYYERLIRRDFADVSLCVLDEHEIDEGMDAFFELHTLRWRKRWLPGMLADSGRQKFHREIAAEYGRTGCLRLHALRIDGRIRAILYCFMVNGRFLYYLGGFDPALSKYSLGTVLTGYAVRDAVEHGCSEFDFLRGDEHYKSRWTREFRTNTRLVQGQNRIRSRMASATCRLEQRIESFVKRELHKRIGAG